MKAKLCYCFSTILLIFSMQLSAAGPFDLEATQKAAAKGDPVAQSKMGAAYYTGQVGITADRSQAGVWFRKAADQGDLDSMVMLGAMSDAGLGLEQSTTTGKAWYTKAAGLGHEPSKGVLDYYSDNERALKAMQIAHQYSKQILKKR